MQEPSKDNSGDKIYVSETYVVWTSYKYETRETIIRKADGQVLSKEEYTSISDKSNYEKVKKETLYICKSDGSFATEVEYNSKKSNYKKKVIYDYKRISDGVIVNESEFKELTKKSNYSIKINTLTIPEEHKNRDGSSRIIKDIFIKDNGSLESHKKWIQENSIFILKDSVGNEKLSDRLSIDEWLVLDTDKQSLYKKKPLLGENLNREITNDEYMTLSVEAQKFYFVAEEVKEEIERIKDSHGHIFVKHDLFNHDPLLINMNPNNIYSQNGIAEAFAKFAYDNGLSFAPNSEELEQIMHPENELPFI